MSRMHGVLRLAADTCGIRVTNGKTSKGCLPVVDEKRLPDLRVSAYYMPTVCLHLAEAN
ncbi:MAG: hypothetical protein WBH86_13725 [Thermogutta sp.]|nr:hypothetical protein [Thermogutta sp.]HQF14344.1 hypothetical protein [Thermogutta sp.]